MTAALARSRRRAAADGGSRHVWYGDSHPGTAVHGAAGRRQRPWPDNLGRLPDGCDHAPGDRALHAEPRSRTVRTSTVCIILRSPRMTISNASKGIGNKPKSGQGRQAGRH
jgi:hypothetical protein